jgi:hypothetical protein
MKQIKFSTIDAITFSMGLFFISCNAGEEKKAEGFLQTA